MLAWSIYARILSFACKGMQALNRLYDGKQATRGQHSLMPCGLLSNRRTGSADRRLPGSD